MNFFRVFAASFEGVDYPFGKTSPIGDVLVVDGNVVYSEDFDILGELSEKANSVLVDVLSRGETAFFCVGNLFVEVYKY